MTAEYGDANLHESSRVILRRLTAEDRDEFTELVKISAELLHPWVYLPSIPAKFDEYLERFDGSTAVCMLICVRESGSIAGTVTISDIIRGPYQRATVGYNAFSPTVGKGYMTEGLNLIFRYAFYDLRLHRLEADIQPGNGPSLSFAHKIGFAREGYSPGFALINGSWKDHERWAINKDMVAAQPD
jgi:ribosomal-protein-alanine N-acetyltransferase